MLVHLADERDARSIRRSGLRGVERPIAGHAGPVTLAAAVFAMPVLPNYYASHQWLREMKRRGMRTMVGVYFRLRTDARVWVGRFNDGLRFVPLGRAVRIIMDEPDPRGFQIIIPFSIPPKAIHAIRPVPQVVGWRYFPDSHARGPWGCLCPGCLSMQRGGIKARRDRRLLIEKFGAEALNIDGDPARLV